MIFWIGGVPIDLFHFLKFLGRGPWKKQKGYCRTYTAYGQQTWCWFGMESNPLRCSFEDSSLCFVSSGGKVQLHQINGRDCIELDSNFCCSSRIGDLDSSATFSTKELRQLTWVCCFNSWRFFGQQCIHNKVFLSIFVCCLAEVAWVKTHWHIGLTKGPSYMTQKSVTTSLYNNVRETS